MGAKEQLQLNNQQLEEHRDFIPTMLTADEARNGQYTWHKYEVLDGKKGKSIGFVVDDDETAYPTDGIHTDGFYYIIYGTPIKIVSWADGTDEEIVTMVQAADKGLIKLSDYWAVGQERKISLSAMPATGVSESHFQQDVTFVLTQAGGKMLSNGKECSFQIDMKNCLNEKGEINSTATNSGGWRDSKRRTWCNDVFKNSIPSTLLPIFKEFKNQTGKGGGSTSGVYETLDFFALRSSIEIFGSSQYAVKNEGEQVEYYKTAANRKKKSGDNGAVTEWWLRSPRYENTGQFVGVRTLGDASIYNSEAKISISPFGCI